MQQQQNGQAQAAYASDSMQYLSFALGEEQYGIEILKVQEIKGYSGITPIPNTAPHIKGVMNLRGTVIPVVDLRTKFSLEQRAYDKFTVIIVVTVGTKIMGLGSRCGFRCPGHLQVGRFGRRRIWGAVKTRDLSAVWRTWQTQSSFCSISKRCSPKIHWQSARRSNRAGCQLGRGIMNWYRNARNATKLMLAFGLMAALMGVVGYEGMSASSTINEMLNTLYEKHTAASRPRRMRRWRCGRSAASYGRRSLKPIRP